MAQIITYPKLSTLANNDLLLVSDVSSKNKNTNSLEVDTLAQYIITTNNVIKGGGTLNYVPIFTPTGTEIGDSQLQQSQLGNGLYQMRFNNADRFIINKPSSVTGGDPEYLIQQDGLYKVSFGWDDDGGGFGFIYNWAGNGLRLGAAGQNPQFELNTVVPKIISHTDHEFEGAILDVNGLSGTAGQLLSSTGTGVQWINVGGGTVTNIATTAPITGGPITTTGTIGITQATSTTDGYLSSTDWNTFNNKASGTGTTNSLPLWSDGPNGVLGTSNVYQNALNQVVIQPQVPTSPSNNAIFTFGVGGGFEGTASNYPDGFSLRCQPGGYYKQTFRFESYLSVGRTTNANQSRLDVGSTTDTIPAAWFRNGVVVSNNPSGVSVDNTSMVIGAGNNDIVSGSDNCLAVGNNNQILNNSDNSLSVGQGNQLEGADNSFCIGQTNTITYSGTTACKSGLLGFNNTLINSFSSFVAGGQNTVNVGQNAVALGFSHNIEGADSFFVFGENNELIGSSQPNNVFMIGGNLHGKDGSMVLGFRNDKTAYPAVDYANGLGNTKFVLGVGTITDTNAMIVTEGGVTRGGGVNQVPRVILPSVVNFNFADDTAAATGGVPVGGLYHNAGQVRIRIV